MNKKIIACIIAVSLWSSSFGAGASFNDVSRTEWYYQPVMYAAQMGWVSGYSDQTFRPQQEITVLEALHISLKVMGHRHDDERDWKVWTLEEARALNLILPLEFNKYEDPITRKEMVLIGLRSFNDPLTGDYMDLSQDIKDLASVDYYWQKVLLRGYAHGLISGYDDGTIRPDQNLSRAEAVTMISRLYKLQE